MQYKIGDRVKFLSESGGGIIRKIISANLVSVETDDGFEIPTSTREILLMQSETPSERLFERQFSAETNRKQEIAEDIEPTIQKSKNETISNLIVYPADRKPDDYQLSIAFVPVQQNLPISGDLSIYLMNFSSYEVVFSIHHQQQNAFYELKSGQLPAFSKFLIAQIQREELESYTNAHIQCLIVQHQSKRLMAPVSVDMQIKASKFYKESAYSQDRFLHQSGLIYKLFDFKNVPVINQLSLQKEVDVLAIKSVKAAKNDAIVKHKTAKDKAVVDMHIWELVEDHSRLTNLEMLNVQLDYFEQCLQSAIDHKLRTVVFIHGVGTGKLKEEIKQIMDQKDFLKYRPASMSEFGVGATQVDLLLGDYDQ
jgi:hypothetical protein